MNNGDAILIRGNALQLPLPDNSVDLIVTSPPYFGLRSYQDGGEHYDGQIGDEATPTEFLDALINATSEMMRVLKPSGSIWVNLGDKYANKSLLAIPWRYAIRCVDELGLILRAEVIWSKPNGLPESVTDRVRRSHEQWFHFTKSASYFTAIDELREPHIGGGEGVSTAARKEEGWGPNRGTSSGTQKMTTFAGNPLGKLPGSVWSIPTEPLVVPEGLPRHFAAYPTELPRRIIMGWAPTRGICLVCHEPRRPVVHKITIGRDNNALADQYGRDVSGSQPDLKLLMKMKAANPDRIVGYACHCPEPDAPTTPAVVLDPFGGTGTTAAVAKALGCIGISNDMSSDYIQIAKWRTNGEGYTRIARKLAGKGHTVTPPPAQHPTLFGDHQ